MSFIPKAIFFYFIEACGNGFLRNIVTTSLFMTLVSQSIIFSKWANQVCIKIGRRAEKFTITYILNFAAHCFPLNFLVRKIKEWEFQKKIYCSLPYFYTYPRTNIF